MGARRQHTTMRAFLAVDLRDTLGPAVHAWGQTVAHELGPHLAGSLTWVAASRIHVTLRFFASLSPQQAEAVVGALAPAPAAHPPFELAIGSAGTFPGRGRPRVLWMGFSRGHDALARVHDWVRPRLAGVVEDDVRETFSPHVTVARVRRDGGPGFAAALREAAARTPAPHARTHVERLTLFESVLSPKGPTYTPLVTFPLAGDGEPAGGKPLSDVE